MKQTGKILYACEHEEIARILAEALSDYQVKRVDSFAEINAQYPQFLPDLTIVSEELPDGTALDLVEKIYSANPMAQIILVSPDPPKLSQESVLTAGFSIWLRFPLDAGTVQQVVDNHFQRIGIAVETFGDVLLRSNKVDSVLAQIKDGMMVIGEDGKLAMVNPAAQKALGLTTSMLGKPFEKVFNRRAVLDAIKGDVPDPTRVEILGEDRAYYRLTNLNIEGIGNLITLHDISYLKELNRMKTQFVNTVSHDIRSPLTSILGYVELIKRAGEINRQQSEFIDQVQDSVHRITNLISEVLDLGKIESRMDKNFARVSLKEITKDVLVNLQPVITQADLALEVSFEEGLPDIFGDSIQLRQLVENLVGNAIKYTPAGGRITIRGHFEADQLIYQVEDTGRGIPLNDQHKIFEPFYRAENVGEDTEGSGLGLAITKTVVENHRGRIWVDSKPDHGSCFTIVFPVFRE
ncbi:MAG: ATP-binding protein [Anaerolineales bacterium]